jgi:type II secretory pathway predicted ATPase ExeA
MPPYLAGRVVEREGFRNLLRQTNITDNLIITGLRGVGKSVLLESLRPIARDAMWLWTGDDFTESVSLSEASLAERLLTDLSLTLGPIFIQSQLVLPMGFVSKSETRHRQLEYKDLRQIYDNSPGLTTDKLKAVLRHVGALIKGTAIKGIVFAYDEAQNLSDKADSNQYPLSILLDVFQSLQRSPGGLPFMLVLTGLPTLFPKLNETRTYTERMFDVFTLDKLTPDESREAILVPIKQDNCPVTFTDNAVQQIVEMSGGYPYFLQFICKEFFDVVIAKMGKGEVPIVPASDIIRKLDQRFFSARWDKASDRQREFMMVAALIPGNRKEFTVSEIVQTSRDIMAKKKFSTAGAGMMLKTLNDQGFIFRNRRGKYSFTVPMHDEFIIRQMGVAANLPVPFGDATDS